MSKVEVVVASHPRSPRFCSGLPHSCVGFEATAAKDLDGDVDVGAQAHYHHPWRYPQFGPANWWGLIPFHKCLNLHAACIGRDFQHFKPENPYHASKNIKKEKQNQIKPQKFCELATFEHQKDLMKDPKP